MPVGTSSAPLVDREQLVLSRMPFALAIAGLLAALGNSLLRLGATLVIDVDPALLPLRLMPPIVVSVLAAVGAALVLSALHRWNSRPVHTFTVVAVVVLVASFIPLAVIGLVDEPPAGLSGIDVPTLTVLGLMHVVAFATIVPTLIRLTRPTPAPDRPASADTDAETISAEAGTTEAGTAVGGDTTVEQAVEPNDQSPGGHRTAETTPARD
ncbi:hypothetical protein FHR81_000450 [Actinoalloteichus hoggarensis]|uniref:Uncharacterized protein n=1 Tax=Actinoalloteichus hoggarensis TaxID=1470176 RepID=A0A221W230_9PSEU|nr:DUF6069 family protein [Actinoalloteichus hoggarensis]ASO19870.1 hypothetical protein AHOG_11135 [Actinoalloteichus hoggarensis]MBB5919421.1 hypothetical protein [Actinoalloteichus hoggarensis]